MPKVSVLMPIYNTEEQILRDTIESILNQTYKDFEFLILNDSPDNTQLDKIVASFNDGRIKYLRNDKNIGISPSRNKLIDIAKGEYLAVMDHDDIAMPERFAKQVEFLDNNMEYGVVSARVQIFNTTEVYDRPSNDDDIKLALVHSCAVIHPVSMIRKAVLIDNNIRYEETYTPAEDYALWCRLSLHTKFHKLDDVLLQYRSHGANTSGVQSMKMEDSTVRIRAFMKESQPDLYALYMYKARDKTIIRLFNFLPILSIVTTKHRTKVLLFDFIPILSIKRYTKIK